MYSWTRIADNVMIRFPSSYVIICRGCSYSVRQLRCSPSHLKTFIWIFKAHSSFVMYVHLHAWNNLSPAGWIVTKIYIVRLLLEYLQIIRIWLKSDITNRLFTRRPSWIYYNNTLYWKLKRTFVGRRYLSENRTLYEIITRKATERQRSVTELYMCIYSFCGVT